MRSSILAPRVGWCTIDIRPVRSEISRSDSWLKSPANVMLDPMYVEVARIRCKSIAVHSLSSYTIPSTRTAVRYAYANVL